MYTRSSVFYLWLITGVLSYANKIPFISKLIKLLGLWYGRTTIWRLLIMVRKIFITVNALIGVYMVYKTVGFSSDNLIAGFVGMGHTYIEIIFNGAKRLFHWFFDLLDMKVVPNVPSNKPTTNPGEYMWFPRGIDQAWRKSLPDLSNVPSDLLKNPFNININVDPTPWYKNYMTWVYIIGGVGLLYCGYKFVTEPLWVLDVFNSKKGPNITQTTSSGDTTPIQLSDTGAAGPSAIKKAAGAASDFSKKIGSTVINVYSQVTNALNPFNWLSTDTDIREREMELFIKNQNDVMNYNDKLYPFTPANPYAPWYEKLRIFVLGETSGERSIRHDLKRAAFNSFIPISSSETRLSGSLTPVAQLGIGVPSPTVPGFVEAVSAINNLRAANLDASLPTLDPQQVFWVENVVDPNAVQEYADNLARKASKGKEVLTDSALAGRVAGLHDLKSPASQARLPTTEYPATKDLDYEAIFDYV